MRLKPLITLLVLPLLLGLSSITQLPVIQEAANAAGTRAVSQSLNEKGLLLLDEIINEAPTLRLAENRAIVQANAADLLWARDEQRARALFGEAVANVSEMTNSVPTDDVEYESLLQESEELRRSVLEMAARHDAQFARTLLRTTTHPDQEPSNELRLELSLASQAVAKDPRQAARLAEETLEKGVDGRLPELIAEIQVKDREAAARLASAVVTKLRSTHLAANEEATGVAFGLFRLAAEPPAGPGAADSPAPLLDRQAMEMLAETIISVALTTSADNTDLLLELQLLLPVVERHAPARVPLVRRKIARLPEATSQPGSSSAGAARKSEPEEDKLQAAAKAGREDEARTLLAAMRNPAERVAVLLQLAKVMTAKNERKHAGELLEEARGLVNNRARNFEQLGTQLRVACAFAPLDPARGLGIIEPLVDQLNEVASAAVVVNGFITEEQLARDDELELKFVREYVDSLSDEAVEDFAMLTRARFDEMKQVANRFQRNELRIMARLLIVRGVLTQQ